MSIGLEHRCIQRIRAERSEAVANLSDLSKDDLRGPALERGPGRNGLVAALTMHQRVIE
jgi:hypothetical protein